MIYSCAKVKIRNKNNETVGFKFIIAVPGVDKDQVHISYYGDELELGIDEHAPDADDNIEVIENDIEFNGTTMTLSCNGLNLAETKATVKNGLITIVVPTFEKPKKNIIKIG